MITTNGGPAFPRNYNSDGHNGMTLRDYFAGLAMQGMYASDTPDWHCSDSNVTSRAIAAYGVADAMLKAREV